MIIFFFFTSANHFLALHKNKLSNILIIDNEIIGFAKLVEVVAINYCLNIKQHLFGRNIWHGYLYAKRKNENVERFIAQTSK